MIEHLKKMDVVILVTMLVAASGAFNNLTSGDLGAGSLTAQLLVLLFGAQYFSKRKTTLQRQQELDAEKQREDLTKKELKEIVREERALEREEKQIARQTRRHG